MIVQDTHFSAAVEEDTQYLTDHLNLSRSLFLLFLKILSECSAWPHLESIFRRNGKIHVSLPRGVVHTRKGKFLVS